MDLQVVLTNWKRPNNLPVIVRMIKAQDVACKIYVVDNHEESQPEFALPKKLYKEVTDVFKWQINTGPTCRFVPALVHHDCEYTIFHDDDVSIGPRAYSNLLAQAGEIGQFATISYRGQNIRMGKRSAWLRGKGVRYDRTWPVDVTCNLHLIRTRNITHAINLEWKLLDLLGQSRFFHHDDILLSFGLQQGTGHKSYLVPCRDGGINMRLRKLTRGHTGLAMSADTEHSSVRSQFVRQIVKCGFLPPRFTQGEQQLLLRKLELGPT